MMNNNRNGMNPMQLFSMVSQSNNPMGMMSQMMGNNPFFQQAMKMAEGKGPQEMKEIINNVAQQKGITPEQINNFASMFGITM